MSKAVLVMEMPERCEECPLQLEVENEKGIELGTNICRGLGKYNKDSGKKPDWCPLRPMPEKKQNACTHGFAGGWNACIDAIGGGNSDNK